MNDTTPVRRGYLERLERENAALRAALEQYGQHTWECNLERNERMRTINGILVGDMCTCGLTDALAPPPAGDGA